MTQQTPSPQPLPRPRAQALLGYFWQIAADDRVKGGRTGDEIFAAVVACMRDDWADVWAVVKSNGKRIVRERSSAVVADATGEIVGKAFNWIEDVLSGRAGGRR